MGPTKLTLYAIWSHVSKEGFQYIAEVHRFLDSEKDNTDFKKSLIVGDFNSNAQWDKQHGEWSHTNAVNKLGQLGLQSAYHLFSGEPQGKESKPTLFFRKKTTKKHRYHIDYAFIPKHLARRLKRVEIPKYHDWIKFSDHVPLIIDFR